MWRSLLILLPLLAASCTSAQKTQMAMSDRGFPITVDRTWHVDVEISFDEAWNALLATLEDEQWPVDTAVRESGTITTVNTPISTHRDRYACREWPGSTARVDDMRARIVVHLVPLNEITTQVQMKAHIEGRYVFYSYGAGQEHVAGWYGCNSTGAIETDLFDAFFAELGPVRYDEPIFRKKF